MPKFTDAIGFSKLDAYRTCPQKFKFAFIDKLPQPGSPAMDRGAAVHDDAEAYLRGWITALSAPLSDWQEEFDDLRAKNCLPEQAWGFDKNWNKLPNWLHPDTWLRAKSDAHYIQGDTLIIIDFKTGKYRVPSIEQIELYAICGSAVYPEVSQITAEFWFVDADNTYAKQYTAAHLKELRKKYETYFAPIYTDEQWRPAPSRECKWCAYSKSKDGPCQY
jgi:hypothetical protein